MSYRSSSRNAAIAAVVCLLLSAAATAAVLMLDVRPIGVQGTSVGLASLNWSVWSALGANGLCDTLSDGILMLSLLAVLAFGIVGVKQLVQRRSIAKVDRTLWLLLGLYVVMLVAYVGCDMLAVNYAPQLFDGRLKPSFPSSHVLCAVAVAVSSAYAVRYLFPSKTLHTAVTVLAIVVVAAMVLTRMASGAHWCSDILCGLLYGVTLAFAFGAICGRLPVKAGKHSR